MNPGDVVLVSFQDATGTPKLRPAVYLAELPGPYQTMLLCGISTQTSVVLTDWDEPISPADTDFTGSGLHQASVIRLSYLRSARPVEIQAVIGSISPGRLDRLRTRLSDHLQP
jgi:mRNA interferase MazF